MVRVKEDGGVGQCGIIPQGYRVPVVPSGRVPGTCMQGSTIAGLFWVSTLEVMGEDPGGGIAPKP